MATRKKSTASKRKGKGKVEKVMHEYKHHQLRSGGRKRVTNRKQAIAIALSEAREAGADIPKKPGRGAKKKSSSSKRRSSATTSTRKTARKGTTKKASSRKRTAAKR